MLSMDRLSASIVTYNNSEIIIRAVNSILNNTSGIHVIISDNGSTDSTVENIKRIFGGNSRVTLLENGKNLGYGVGNNRTLPHLNSDYHVIVNPDIEIRDDVITRMACFMDNNPQVSVLSPRVLFPDGREQLLPKRNPSLRALIQRRIAPNKLFASSNRYIMGDLDLTKNQELEVATGCFMLTRTSLIKAEKGFDPRFFMYFEDYDLSKRLEKYGIILYNPDFVVYHDWERAGVKSAKYMMIQLHSMIKYFNKWGWNL